MPALSAGSPTGTATILFTDLARLYAWFTEGFATRDLIDAKALLAELG